MSPPPRSRPRLRLASFVAALAAVALILAGCRLVRQVVAKYPRPKIELLYRDAVKNRDRNPVIIVPGFAGAQLVRRSDGRMVWGTLFEKGALRHGRPDGFRALAVDLDALPAVFDQSLLARLADDVVAVAPLAHFEADARVTHISFDVYASLMEVLGAAGYIDGHADHDELRYDPDTCNAFTFVYDWRLDGVANARALGRFIASAREEVKANRRRLGLPEEPVRFDVVAHSMGGLVARYYLRYGMEDVLGDEEAEVTWAGARDVDRLVLISTPSFGSMKVLRDLIYGRGPLILKEFEPVLLATLPALYQMLPRPRHALIVDGAGATVDVDFLDVEVWRQNGWGPFARDQAPYLAWLLPGERTLEARSARMAAFMAAAFERARLFAAALDRTPATRPPTDLVLFAGDAEATLHRGRLVTEGDGRLRLDFDGPDLSAPGDGTVTRFSALADERRGEAEQQGFLRSPIPWDWTVFIADQHTTFLRNPTLQDNLLHLLLERPPKRRAENGKD